MEMKKDILLFMSDQHDGRIMSNAGDEIVRTPNLDQLAKDGTTFDRAYTSCPLCIPARMSMLSGRLPMHTGVFTNRGSLHPETPTFLHSLASAGYETVLCGRMHFEGDDQRHGFTKRIAYDITPTAIGPAGDHWKSRGRYGVTLTEVGCLHVIGAGNSPTLEYDRYVVQAAIEYLSQPHEKPQCIVIGTYAPHFPYVAPEELYNYYLDKVTLPPTLDRECYPPHPAFSKRRIESEPKVVRGARAAYWGMVEFTDQCVGAVKTAWDNYLEQTGREGVFAYISDHGDHVGDRGFNGKQTLYESSVRIPMIFSGSGIQAGNRISSPVSLMDIGSTLCDLIGAEAPPAQDGVSLLPALMHGAEDNQRVVIAEWITNPIENGTEYGRMVCRGDWKLISFVDYPNDDILTRPAEDYWETNPLNQQYAEIAEELKLIAMSDVDAKKIVSDKCIRDAGYVMVAAFNRSNGAQNTETWITNEDGKQLPKDFISVNRPLPPRLQRIWDL